MVIRKDKPFVSKISLKLIWLARALGTQFRTFTQKIGIFAANKLRKVVYKKALSIGIKLKSYIQEVPTVTGNSIKKIYKMPNVFADSIIARKHTLQAKKSLNERYIETGEAKKPAQQIQQPSSNVNARVENVNFSSQNEGPDEIPLECLMCEELVGCTLRKNRQYCSEAQVRIANKP